MTNETPQSSFVVFPFLKTSHPMSIGGVSIRSTDDTTALSPDRSECVAKIKEMLFLKDDLRILSGSYAILPYIDLNDSGNHEQELDELRRLQAVVAYCYAAPDRIHDAPFLPYESASLVIFSPADVSTYAVFPEQHVVRVGEVPHPQPDERGNVQGYHALYNFKHHLWVTKGSRLYGPVPEVVLNLSQDLCADFGQFFLESSHYPLVLDLIERPPNAVSDRVLTAIKWFNEANSAACDDEAAIVSLAIAFETLLRLPEGQKTERIADSVALLLGRIPRLDTWALQFY